MNVATMGSFIVAALALLLSGISMVRNNTKQYVEQMTQLSTQMEEVLSDVREIKADFRREISELKANYRADHDRIIKMEISLDTAWKRIDELRAKG
ncbi:MAG: hypothetical protein IJ799_02195 [Bacteroidales bacterium]|nr:hypothetical protein [Bacteroidales bacterium]